MSEWELRVSQREFHRMHVVRLTIEGRERVGRGAKLLGISPRQMKRLRRKMKERGVEGLLHGNRGKRRGTKRLQRRSRKLPELARGRYQGLNDTHLTEKLKEKEKISCIASHGAHDFASGRDRCGAKRGVKRHYKRRERKAQEGSAVVVGR